MNNDLYSVVQGKSFGNVGVSGGRAHIGDTYNFNASEPPIDAITQILQSLSYPEIEARFNTIASSHPETFEWIFKAASESHEECSFTHWLHYGTGIYLVEGKPGSGKSTLMKFIGNHSHVKQHFASSSIPTQVNVIKHFFWLAGSEIQKSFRGLLASLAHQAAALWPSSIEAATETRSRRAHLEEWSNTDLEQFLITTLTVSSEKTLVLIDGLDEFDPSERPIKLVAFLNKLLTCSNIKLCVSSRPLTWVQQGFSTSLKVMLHELTRSDIDKFATEVLRAEFHLSGYENELELVEILRVIRNKAEGVFLWVKYALNSLVEGLDELDEPQTLKSRLEMLPSGMEELYQHTWARYENSNARHKEEAAMFFQCSQRLPLRLFDLAVMMDGQLYKHYVQNMGEASTDTVQEALIRTKRKLMVRTAGLLTCQVVADSHYDSTIPIVRVQRHNTPDDSSEGEDAGHGDPISRSNVNYLHRTVHDFLFSTTYGQSITALSRELKEDLDERWCYTRIASLMQGFVRSNRKSEVHRICEMLSCLENVEGAPLSTEALHRLDRGLRSCFSQQCSRTQCSPWAKSSWFLEVFNFGAEGGVVIDLLGLLVSKGAFETVKNFLAETQPSTYYMSYLLCCAFRWMEVHLRDDHRFTDSGIGIELGTPKLYLSFVQWLLDSGADPGYKVPMIAMFYGSEVHEIHTLTLSPTDMLVNIILSTYCRSDHLLDIYEMQTLLNMMLDYPSSNTMALVISNLTAGSCLRFDNDDFSLHLSRSEPVITMSVSLPQLLWQIGTYLASVEQNFGDYYGM